MIEKSARRIVDDKGRMFHSKVVVVGDLYATLVDGQRYYECWCEDGSGYDIIPESVLKPISDEIN